MITGLLIISLTILIIFTITTILVILWVKGIDVNGVGHLKKDEFPIGDKIVD